MSLTKRQISNICNKSNIDYRYTKVSPKDCNVDLRISRDPRYRRSNQLEILHKGLWHPIGFLWDIEDYTEEIIMAKINGIIKAKFIGPYSPRCQQCGNDLHYGWQVTSDIEVVYCYQCKLKVKQSKTEGVIDVTPIPVYTIANVVGNTEQQPSLLHTTTNHAHDGHVNINVNLSSHDDESEEI
jgi:hypothetical protein